MRLPRSFQSAAGCLELQGNPGSRQQEPRTGQEPHHRASRPVPKSQHQPGQEPHYCTPRLAAQLQHQADRKPQYHAPRPVAQLQLQAGREPHYHTSQPPVHCPQLPPSPANGTAGRSTADLWLGDTRLIWGQEAPLCVSHLSHSVPGPGGTAPPVQAAKDEQVLRPHIFPHKLTVATDHLPFAPSPSVAGEDTRGSPSFGSSAHHYLTLVFVP